MITAWAVPALLLTALGVSLNSRSETPRTDFADPLGYRRLRMGALRP